MLEGLKKMKVSFTVDQDDGQILAVYFSLAEGKVHKTVEITEGECYIDEDSNGNPLGVEMLCPGRLEILVKRVARKYHIRGMNRAVHSVRETLAV